MEEELIRKLIEMKLQVSTVESCTGGMLMSTLINVSGASKVISEGFITYANAAKQKYVYVKEETLDTYGAVSEQTAREMAEGLHRQTGADVCLSTTGVAGPLGGTKEKPVGTVYIGCYYNGTTEIERLQIHGDRYSIRQQTVQKIIEMTLNVIDETKKPYN